MVVPARLRAAGAHLVRALAFPLEALPALVLAWLCLRIVEAIHASGAGVPQATLFGAGLGNDLLSLLRFGFVFLFGALPLALIPSRRWRTLVLGLVWSALLLAHAALLHYHWVSDVAPGPLLGVGAVAALAVLWTLLSLSVRPWWPRAGSGVVLAGLGASVLAFALLPQRFAPPVARTDADLAYLGNKTAWFLDNHLARLRGPAGNASPANATAAGGIVVGKVRRTPDTTGRLFEAAFTNHGATRSAPFIPLLVIANEHAVELGETPAEVRTLEPGETATIVFRPDLRRVPQGTWFVSVLPSHPETGRPVGAGQYRVETIL